MRYSAWCSDVCSSDLEGAPKWRVLPRNQQLSQLVSPVPSQLGLQNPDCSVMPVLIFTRDHRAQTIDGIVQAVKKFQRDNAGHGVAFKLASGNVGVLAATNEEIRARAPLVISWVHSPLALFMCLCFRNGVHGFCIVQDQN